MTQDENIYIDHLKYVRCRSIGLIKEAAEKLWRNPSNMDEAQVIYDELKKYIETQSELDELTNGDRYVSKTNIPTKEP